MAADFKVHRFNSERPNMIIPAPYVAVACVNRYLRGDYMWSRWYEKEESSQLHTARLLWLLSASAWSLHIGNHGNGVHLTRVCRAIDKGCWRLLFCLCVSCAEIELRLCFKSCVSVYRALLCSVVILVWHLESMWGHSKKTVPWGHHWGIITPDLYRTQIHTASHQLFQAQWHRNTCVWVITQWCFNFESKL